MQQNSNDTPRIAKLFWNGRSQAVRLPKEFRFEGEEVIIRREGARVILEAVDEWGEDFWSCFGAIGEDFDLGNRHEPAEREDPLA